MKARGRVCGGGLNNLWAVNAQAQRLAVFERHVRRRILCIKIYLGQNVLFALAIGVRNFKGFSMTIDEKAEDIAKLIIAERFEYAKAFVL